MNLITIISLNQTMALYCSNLYRRIKVPHSEDMVYNENYRSQMYPHHWNIFQNINKMNIISVKLAAE